MMKKTTMRFLATVLLVIMLFSIMPVFAGDEPEGDSITPQFFFEDTGVRTPIYADDWTSLQAAVAIADSTTYVELADDIIMLNSIAVTPGTDLMIVSSGGEYSLTSASGKRHFTIAAGGETTLSFDGKTTLQGGINSGGIDTASVLNINDAIITECERNDLSCGGGVYATADVTVTGGIISNNMAGNGGGIFVSDSIVTLDSCVVIDNTASYNSTSSYTAVGYVLEAHPATFYPKGNGGGIFVYNGDVIVESNSAVSYNTASYDYSTGNAYSGNGGGIFVLFGDITVSDSLISDNTTSYNANNGNGYNGSGAGMFTNNGDVTIYGSAIINNAASHVVTSDYGVNGNGGGIFLKGDVIVDDSTISSNTVTYTVNGYVDGNSGTNGNGNGGGIYIAQDGGGATLSNSTISYNAVNYSYGSGNGGGGHSSGGGIYVFYGEAIIDACTIIYNTTGAGNYGSSGNGGGVHVRLGDVTISGDSIISHNDSGIGGMGGGIYVGGDITVTGGEISNNTSGYGGGIWANDNVLVYQVTISDNTAYESITDGGSYGGTGGGIGGRNITISDSTITHNTGEWGGGGVFANGDVIIEDTSIITYNTTGGNGGGVYSQGYVATDDSEIAHNTAGFSGGGIFAGCGGFPVPIGLSVTNSVIDHNTATTGDGGGLFAYGNATISNSTLSNNTAGYGGGGILSSYWNDPCVLLVEDSDITGNSAALGGGIYVTGENNANIINSTITDNEAAADITGPFQIGDLTEEDGQVYYIISEIIYICNESGLAFKDGLKLAKIWGVNLEESSVDGVQYITSRVGGDGGGIYVAHTAAENDEARAILESDRLGLLFELPELDLMMFAWTPHENISVDEATLFLGNKAYSEYKWNLALSPYYKELHDLNVLTSQFSIPYDNAYNNADVNFEIVPMWNIKYVDESVTVDSFAVPGGSSQEIESGPDKQDKTFLGWAKDGELLQPGYIMTDIQEDVTLTAVWEDTNTGGTTTPNGGGGGETKYTVTFDSTGGSDIPNQSIGSGKKAAKPAAPTKPGYIFKGWYTEDGKEFDFDSNITNEIKLIAQWAVIDDNAATLKVICVDGSGKEIYISITSEAVGETISVNAPQLVGYLLDDDSTKTISIQDGENVLTFKYATRTSEDGKEGLVLDLVNHIKYLNGYPEGDVRADNGITRAEAAAIFFRLLSNSDKFDPVANPFSDVDADAWYGQSVLYLAENGIIQGYSDGTFRPNEPITRAEFATLASKFDSLDKLETALFNDVSESHWAFSFINSANAKGWVSGFPDGTFKPEDKITRAQVVTIVNRMLKRKIELSDIPNGVVKYTDLATTHWAYCDIIEASVWHDYKRKGQGSISEIWIEFDNGTVVY